jgi:D-2-hydroxyacid dehydrogenase (NADP+)
MTGILLSRSTSAKYRDELAAAVREAGIESRVMHLPEDPASRLTDEERADIEIAFLTRDLRFSDHYAAFGETLAASPGLKWMHFVSTAIDPHPFLPELVKRRVRLTTSAGSNGEPVAQTAIGGMLLLARHFPQWWSAQGRREWVPLRGDALPRDLRGQTVAIVGIGTIGTAVARFCQALGMHVIGVRRSPRRPSDPVHETHTLAALPTLLPRCDWVVLACPLTPETRHIIDAGALARLPRGARLVNVARGGVVDEPALISALRTGRLGGAYLDVYEKEPLPSDSPLWDLPNVIISPHNASASSGNNDRAMKIFLANLVRWGRGQPLLNEEKPV